MNKIFFSEKDGKYILPINRNGFTTNDNNSEFTDSLLMNWSYPFDVYMTEEMIRDLGDFNDPNIILQKKYDEGFLNIEGNVFPAKLKFITCQQSILKCQIEYGYESLAIFDKKLADLEFETLNPANIYDYIDAEIGKKYPEAKFCFPAIYTEKFKDVDRNSGFTFQDIYNELDGSGKIKRNKITNDGFFTNNIIKPCVYLMHVLKHGFGLEGFEIAGDILNNEFLMNAALDHENEFYIKFTQQKENVSVTQENNYYYSTQPTVTGFSATRSFVAKGVYNLSLVTQKETINTVQIQAVWNENGNIQTVTLDYSGNQGPDYTIELNQVLPAFLFETIVNITISGTLFDVPNIAGGSPPGPLTKKTIQGYINPYTGTNGAKEYYETKTSINLNEILPDMTFRDLISSIKKLQNYKLSAKDGKIYFMSVENDATEIINISENDVINFEIGTNERLSYILSHGAPDEYAYQEVEYGRTGVLNSGLNIENDKADKITFNSYPLPIENKGYGLTAIEKTEPGSGVVLIRYDGLQGGKNLTISLEDLRIPIIYTSHYKRWIRNRIEARKMKWSYYTADPEAGNITSDRKIGAYKNAHKIIGITKKFVSDDAYYVEIESENRP